MRIRIPLLSVLVCYAVLMGFPAFPSTREATLISLLNPNRELNTTLTATPPTSSLMAGTELMRIGPGVARAIAWSPDSQILAVGSSLGIGLFTRELKPITFFSAADEITAVAWNPNGKQIATASRDRVVQLWDVASGKALILESTPSANETLMGSVTYSSDGAHLASASAQQKAAHIWETATGKLIATLHAENPVYAVAWKPGSNQIALGGARLSTVMDSKVGKHVQLALAFVQIWNVTTVQVLIQMNPVSDSNAYPLYYNREYNTALPPAVALLQWYDHNKRLVLNGFLPDSYFVDWIIDAQQVTRLTMFEACGSIDKGPVSVSPDSLNTAAGFANFCDATPDDRYLGVMIDSEDEGVIEAATSAEPGHVRIASHPLEEGIGFIRAIAWAADSRTLAFLRNDGRLSVNYIVDESSVPLVAMTDFYTAQPYQISSNHDPNQILDSILSPADLTLHVLADSRTATLGYYDVGQFKIPNVGDSPLFYATTTEPLAGFYESNGLISGPYFGPMLSPDMTLLVAGFEDNRIRARPITPLQLPPKIDIPSYVLDAFDEGQNVSFVLPLAYIWNPDKSKIAASWGSNLAVWGVATGQLLVNIPPKTTYPYIIDGFVAWAPDGRLLLHIWDEGVFEANKQSVITHAEVVDGQTGNILYGISPEVNGASLIKGIRSVQWLPTGSSFSIVDNENVVRIWNAASGQLLQTSEGTAIKWSPDGTQLAITHLNRSVSIYSSATGAVNATIQGSTGDILRLEYAPDGKRLATSDSNGLVRVWDVSSGKLLITFTGHRGAVLWVKWKADGSQILSRGLDGTLRLWRTDG